MTETPGPTAPVDPPIRYLDPSTVRRRPGRGGVESTWYVADRLIVHGEVPPEMWARSRRIPDPGAPGITLYEVEPAESPATRVEAESRRQGCRIRLGVREGADETVQSLYLLTERPDVQPDAWELREADLDDESTAWRLSLDHVMTTQPFTSHPFTSHPFTSHPFTSHPFTSHPFTSHPFTSHPFTSHPFTSHPFSGMAEYAVPGRGGRTPVAWQGGRPARTPHDDERRMPDGTPRPVVAVVDTGLGSHPWFGTYSLQPGGSTGNGVVLRDVLHPDGRPIGTYPVPGQGQDDAEIGGTSAAPLTGPLDPVAGHGTFIAGIVHQICPDARILPVRAVGGTGVGIESEVIESLERLVAYQRAALEGDGEPVDVVVISMGYYHERPEDLEIDHPLRRVLDALGESGAAVVAASGNDGSTRPEYPAAFAPAGDRRAQPPVTVPEERERRSTPLPAVLAVGALNPDGTTALFSNDGEWVTHMRPGAAVVSTVPTTLDGPLTPSVRLKERLGDGHRATIDPEGFDGGFASWSGTSFAAPVVAAEIAQHLLDARSGAGGRRGRAGRRLDDRARRREDVWGAIAQVTGGPAGAR
ncbi:S8 family serine peptidase [Isoptericola sp. b408]|uniref:S8 family peptidase n=1 Tax=Isoptericola sp. b408 TaxID=3064653 RepID=UPI002712BD62|nr:S8 family serine peptidase [Isoptericola sp. b408]MDO8150628.1 S8 family serine peptidase [Isoptericola sp. b408]